MAVAVAVPSGCGGAPPVAGQTPASRAGDSAAWLVWSAREGGAAETAWIDAGGTELAAREGVVVAHGGALYRGVVETERARLASCEQLEQDRADSPEGELAVLRRLSLVELGGARRIVLAVPAETSGVASLEQDIEPVASLGPYLLVRSSLASFACGAHGNVQVALRAIDLRSGEPIELLSGREEERASTLAERAVEQLTSPDAGATDDEPIDASAIRHVATVPVLDRGRVAIEHVFEADVCYACSDPEWSSYTRVARVRDDVTPERLAPHATFPEGVSRWLADHPEARGVSVVSAADAGRLLSIFRGPHSAATIDTATTTSSAATRAATSAPPLAARATSRSAASSR